MRRPTSATPFPAGLAPVPLLAVLLLAMLLAGCTAPGAEPVPAGTPAAPTAPAPSPPAATGEPSGEPATGEPGPGDGPVSVTPADFRLAAFDSCDALLDWYVDGASDLVGPWGLGGGGLFPMEEMASEAAMAEDGEPALADASAAGGDDAGRAVSGTNVQEEGVDEPDVVKTDGELIVTVVERGLRVVDVDAGEVVGRLALPEEAWNAELLLSGDDLLVLTTGSSWEGPGPGPTADRVPAFPPERTTIMRVDLSDPSEPRVVGQVRLEGSYRSARMVDGTVRIVVVSQPTGLSFVQPSDGGLAAEDEAEQENRRIIRESDLDDWIPHLQVLGPDGSPGEVRPLLDCADITHPAEFSGLSTVSVLTLDIAGDAMEPSSGAGLVAAGDTVYASTDRLLVTTSPWGQWIQPFVDVVARPDDGRLSTDVHAFDISDPARTDYVGSGSVEGTLIGQFALSETDGIVRVATTTQPAWWDGREGAAPDLDSQSSLVVLEEADGALVERGRVDGLGVTEQIQSVRYLGPDLAAIVTFRQTDPLYLVDTSDPADPRVTGELKIPGFSSYLHPVAEGRLLGVGQDADRQGRTTGLQVSLFDVSDLASPDRIDQVTFGEGWSPVEQDHRAFLHWAPTGQVVLPAELWGSEDPWLEFEECQSGDDAGACREPRPFIGAVVLEADGETVTEQGRVALVDDDDRRQDWWGEVRRTLVIDDDLWLVAPDRLVRVTLDGLDDRAEVSLR